MKNYASKGRRIGLLLAMLFITSWMFAQVTVTGNVRDERDEGAIGATVLLVGSQKGAITDSEGNFKLSVPNAQSITNLLRRLRDAEDPPQRKNQNQSYPKGRGQRVE